MAIQHDIVSYHNQKEIVSQGTGKCVKNEGDWHDGGRNCKDKGGIFGFGDDASFGGGWSSSLFI